MLSQKLSVNILMWISYNNSSTERYQWRSFGTIAQISFGRGSFGMACFLANKNSMCILLLILIVSTRASVWELPCEHTVCLLLLRGKIKTMATCSDTTALLSVRWVVGIDPWGQNDQEWILPRYIIISWGQRELPLRALASPEGRQLRCTHYM